MAEDEKTFYGRPLVNEPTKKQRNAARAMRQSLEPLLLRYQTELMEQARRMGSAEDLLVKVVQRGKASGVLGP